MTYEKMKASFSPVTVYDRDAEHLDDELRTYAEELDLLYEELDEMFRERFIATAQDRGLSEYERLFGPERTDLDTDQRRRMLYLRMNLGEGDFTPAGIRKATDSFGLNCVINEFPAIGKLNIVATTEYSPTEQAFISREVSKIIPVHLDFQLTFNTLAWSEIDALNKTFAQIASDDLTWKQLDERTNS